MRKIETYKNKRAEYYHKFHYFMMYRSYYHRISKAYKVKQALMKLTQKMNNDKGYHELWEKDFGVKDFTYLDYYTYDGIPTNAYGFISAICEYFECVAIWDRILIPDTTIGMKTIRVYGYSPDIRLCKRYLVIILQRMKVASIDKEKELIDKGLNQNDVTKYTNLYINGLLRRYNKVTSEILGLKIPTKYKDEKIKGILNFIESNVNLDYGKRNWKKRPNIQFAFSRPFIFKSKKIIKYVGYEDKGKT